MNDKRINSHCLTRDSSSIIDNTNSPNSCISIDHDGIFCQLLKKRLNPISQLLRTNYATRLTILLLSARSEGSEGYVFTGVCHSVNWSRQA